MDKLKETLFLVKPGTFSKTDKAKLIKNGAVVVEHPEPGYVRMIDLVKTRVVSTRCLSCGENIYMTQEKMDALKAVQRKTFYCLCGQGQFFK